MNEFEYHDAIYQRDQGIGVPYPETEGGRMNVFTSDELKTINKALDFYKYQMSTTTNMDEYRAWKSTRKKFNERLEYRHGVWSWRTAECKE